MRRIVRNDLVESGAVTGVPAAKRVGDNEAAAWTTQNLGAGLIRAQRLDDALDVCREAVRLRRESGNRKGYGTALFNLAGVYLLREQYRECVATLELALPVQQEFENTLGLGAALDGLGTAHFHLGEHATAESYYERALAVFGKNGDIYNEAACWINIGRLRRAQRQWMTAAEVLRDAVDRNIRVGHRYGEAEAREHLGLVNADLGNHTEAVAELTAAMAIFRELDEDAAARVAAHLAELRARHPSDATGRPERRDRCAPGPSTPANGSSAVRGSWPRRAGVSTRASRRRARVRRASGRTGCRGAVRGSCTGCRRVPVSRTGRVRTP